jgi:hypothetical protein
LGNKKPDISDMLCFHRQYSRRVTEDRLVHDERRSGPGNKIQLKDWPTIVKPFWALFKGRCVKFPASSLFPNPARNMSRANSLVGSFIGKLLRLAE